MGIFQWLLNAQTLRGILIAIGLWILGKIIDRVLSYFFGRKVISPAIAWIRIKFKGLLTYFRPISSSYQLTYSPKAAVSVSQIKEDLAVVHKGIEDESGSRIQFESISWDGLEGECEVTYFESRGPYEVEIYIQQEQGDFLDSETPTEEANVAEINYEIDFEFSFPKLESELSNVGIFVSQLERSLDSTLGGISSNPRIILQPLEGQLSLDRWIERENFDMSLRLSFDESDIDRASVEFHTDHVEVRPPYYQIDSEVSRYIRLLVMNYYLKENNSSNLLSPRR